MIFIEYENKLINLSLCSEIRKIKKTKYYAIEYFAPAVFETLYSNENKEFIDKVYNELLENIKLAVKSNNTAYQSLMYIDLNNIVESIKNWSI